MCTQVLCLHHLHHQFTKSTIIFTVSSLFLLAVMAYDHFVAISNPLSYNVVMSPDICMGLLAGAYVCGLSRASCVPCVHLPSPSVMTIKSTSSAC